MLFRRLKVTTLFQNKHDIPICWMIFKVANMLGHFWGTHFCIFTYFKINMAYIDEGWCLTVVNVLGHFGGTRVALFHISKQI